jgi:hypothetical protein
MSVSAAHDERCEYAEASRPSPPEPEPAKKRLYRKRSGRRRVLFTPRDRVSPEVSLYGWAVSEPSRPWDSSAMPAVKNKVLAVPADLSP